MLALTIVTSCIVGVIAFIETVYYISSGNMDSITVVISDFTAIVAILIMIFSYNGQIQTTDVFDLVLIIIIIVIGMALTKIILNMCDEGYALSIVSLWCNIIATGIALLLVANPQ